MGNMKTCATVGKMTVGRLIYDNRGKVGRGKVELGKSIFTSILLHPMVFDALPAPSFPCAALFL